MEIDIVRAWKDPVYRESLDAAALPRHPAGLIELSDDQLKEASGGSTVGLTTAITCTEFTFHGWKACCPAS